MSDGNDTQPAISARHRSSPAARRVVLVAFDGVEPVDITGPSSVFARANRQRPDFYELVHATHGGESVATNSGLRLSGLRPLAALRGPIDTLLVGGGSEAGLRAAIGEDQLARWVERRAPRIRRVGSICTGAFVLAAAGLLDGRRAVTHWASCELLKRMRPAIEVDADAIFVVDGPVYTSAGVTAGIDLALALVEEDLGRDVAASIAREMVLFLRRSGGQSQYSDLLSSQAGSTETFAELLRWIVEHPDADLSVGALTRRAGLSERTFLRAFSRETGATPAALVRRVRVDCARRLLETTDWPVKRIAERSGFGSEDSLARAFRTLMRLTPDEFRARFRRPPVPPRGRIGRRRERGRGCGRPA